MAAQTRTKYESDGGLVHPIRMSPEKAALAGTAPTGAVDSSVSAMISKGNSEFGIRPRGVTLSYTVGTGATAYSKSVFLPVLTETAYDSAAFAIDATITYKGIACKVSAKVAERSK